MMPFYSNLSKKIISLNKKAVVNILVDYLQAVNHFINFNCQTPDTNGTFSTQQMGF